MASKPSSSDNKIAAPADGPAAPELDKKIAADTEAAPRTIGDKAAASSPPDDEDDDHELDIDDDEDDEDLVVFTAKEAAGALATIYAFIKPFLKNYKKILTFVGLGVLVETLLTSSCAESEIPDRRCARRRGFPGALYDPRRARGRRHLHLDRRGLVRAVDARLAAALISDVRTRLFEHVQDLPAAFFARTRRGEILSRFSVDLSAFEGLSRVCEQRGVAVPRMIAGIILMLFLNWQLAAVALLVFPITLIGPRILTPKAVQANYEQKLNEAALLGMVQENIAAQAVVKAFSLQRRALGWFTMRNDEARRKIASADSCRPWSSARLRSPSCCCTSWCWRSAPISPQGPNHHRTFVTFESAFWRCPTTSPT